MKWLIAACMALISMPAISADEFTYDHLPEHAKKQYLSYCNNGHLPKDQRYASRYNIGDDYELILVRCYLAAYNGGSLGFVIDADDNWQLLAVPIRYSGSAWTAAHVIEGGHYDEKAKRLISYFKHRGVGDCWTQAEYFFKDGKPYLNHLESKTDCDGSMDLGEKALIYDYEPSEE